MTFDGSFCSNPISKRAAHFSEERTEIKRKKNRFNFEKLEVEIVRRIHDTAKAKILISLYRETMDQIEPVWPDFATHEFLFWIKDCSKFLGSTAIDHLSLMTRSLPTSLMNSFTQQKQFNERLRLVTLFFETLQKNWGQTFLRELSLPKQESKKRVLILSRTYCGRGHQSVAETLNDYLLKKGYQAHVMDSKEFEESPSKIVSYQASAYDIDTSMGEMRDKIAALWPALIINTVAHHNYWGQVPMIYPFRCSSSTQIMHYMMR